MAPATRTDPYLNGNFLVQIDGITSASFSEVSGLEADIEVIEYRSGDAKQAAVQKLPGLHKFTNITLKRGLVQDQSLWNWMQTVLNGNVQRTNVSIILLDRAENPVWRWNLTNAWPCKWSGPILKAESDEVAIETLEICYENLTASAGT
jgi:phage tail-like protein